MGWIRRMIQNRELSKEKPDPVPHEGALIGHREPSMQQLIQQYVRNEASLAAQDAELGSFEDEDDFDLDDYDNEPDLTSQYTVSELSDEINSLESLDGTQDEKDPVTQPLTAAEDVSETHLQEEPPQAGVDTPQE
jgi:hypothetical protein